MTLNPFRFLKEEREKDRELMLLAISEMNATVRAFADVAKQQAEIASSYMKLVYTSEAPGGWTTRDQDELEGEREREKDPAVLFSSEPDTTLID